ncbi:MAG TPA: exodeoxyribonuclease VII large subunit [Planctomycetaceae bacterium]|nr:exodeoxyribonuclease VII large subunit [Planctomycetaceae bacterium]|tara:strand:+ start:8694 stop:9938 length:1245 start_codon:yes stop_codon:yes gene_type:complete
MTDTQTGNTDTFLSVSQLNEQIKETLKDRFSQVRVVGEVSDVKRPPSGHVYLTLKDQDARIRAVIWRGTAQRFTFDFPEGQEVLCTGAVDVYPPRGDYQLIIRQMEPIGAGVLQMRLRQLQEQLAAEGLFDAERKVNLPAFPRQIAFVTSPTGAAIRDFLEVAQQRWKGIHVTVIPSRVQGQGAAEEIAAGIAAAEQLCPLPDALIVGRGGGSQEDLWCFNDELVVRAIAACKIPVVSAVGHEIDVTLSDLAADLRALTPTAAGDIVASSKQLMSDLDALKHRLIGGLRTTTANARRELGRCSEANIFRYPFTQVKELSRYLDDLAMRGTHALRNCHRQSQERITGIAGKLESLSPLAVLARGYSVTQTEHGQILTNPEHLEIADRIHTRLADGTLVSRVESIETPPHTDPHQT